ncbi:MAG: hypothetical protein HN948_06175 [Clostridia bacterium]|jgi:uroporphyrinogen decarboxylase|nr:hypothetical protein [Clostridia bacterium]MBT7122583.1 hypothetical protein [Clostridia bacterium]
MTSRERVNETVAHEAPDRCPLFLGRVDDFEVWEKAFGVKTADELRTYLGCDLRKTDYSGVLPKQDGKTVWGSDDAWEAGYSGERGGYPLQSASSIADVENYNWPDPSDVDYSLLKQRTLGIDPRYSRILSLGFLPPFNTLMDLFGMEEALVMFYTSPEVIEAALERITDYLTAVMTRAMNDSADYADFFWLGDDFSTQRGMMISPELWRRFLKPVYKKLFKLIKSFDLKVWFHSCGSFEPVRPDLVDIGIDVWETVQAHLEGNEPEKLKNEFGKHVTFFGAINCQQTLSFGTPEDVRKEVRERISVFGTDGGYICGPDHSIQGNMPPENIFALFDEARKI